MKLLKFLLLVAFLVHHPILSSSPPPIRHLSEFLFTSCLLLHHPCLPLQASLSLSLCLSVCLSLSLSLSILKLGKRRAIISHFPRVFQIE
jgi:hypothetical protein